MKKDLEFEIEKEREEDPSKDIFEIEEKVKQCDPLIGIIHLENKDNATMEQHTIQYRTKESEVKVCKFHTNGFCRRGQTCIYLHSKQDCKEHTESGKCTKSVCLERHRQDCWFYKSRKGCNNAAHCNFLHRDNSKANEIYEDEEKKRLEIEISDLRREISNKDSEIKCYKQEVKQFKIELKSKEKEINDKEEIIQRLEDEGDSSSDEESQDEEKEDNKSLKEKTGLAIVQGHFGKEFIVREGMEEEAATLRREWSKE